MKNKFFLTLYNDISYWKLVEAFYDELILLIDFPPKEAAELKLALKELFENAVFHAYEPNEDGKIWLTFELFSNGIKIDVRDKGLPFDEKLLKKIDTTKGLKRAKELCDSFHYHNLGLEGKSFSIIKYVPIQLRLQENIPFYSDIGLDLDQDIKNTLEQKLIVRPFKEGDETAIPKLIYKNYGYTYFKDLFYYPQKILQKEKKGEILSIVAEVDGKIVGHFAMVRLRDSNIAEIGVAVVDPAYKGMGIMKKMFTMLLQKAQEMGLDALFGEAITFHPYSQRANARFGFKTTALLLGDIHQMVRLKDHPYPYRERRGAVAVEYKIFHPKPKKVTLPSRYSTIIQKTYELLEVPIEISKPPLKDENDIKESFDQTFNIATITINNAQKDFAKAFKYHFEKALHKHPDMIYADINIESCNQIDEVIDVLRSFDFFYAGLLPLRHQGKDYLRMQFEASDNIEEQHIVCYSDFCKELHQFILKDKNSLH